MTKYKSGDLVFFESESKEQLLFTYVFTAKQDRIVRSNMIDPTLKSEERYDLFASDEEHSCTTIFREENET